MDYVFIAGGLVMLFVGGELLVRGSVTLAQRLGLSSLLIGLTVVGFGTSTPELLVSLQAAWRGASEIAIGNVVGSNTANILLITGLAIILAPIATWPRSAIRDGVVMVVAAAALMPLALMGFIPRWAGLALLLALIVYVGMAYVLEAREKARLKTATLHEEEAEDLEALPVSAPLAALAAVGGIAVLVGGAHFLVEGAVSIARGFGISEAVIGLTLVAVGTSLPELATAIVAAIRKHSDVVLGNVIGSNIFNVFCILGVTALITPVPIAPRFAQMDIPIMLGVSAFFLVVLMLRRGISRVVGATMVGVYVLYTWSLFAMGAV